MNCDLLVAKVMVEELVNFSFITLKVFTTYASDSREIRTQASFALFETVSTFSAYVHTNQFQVTHFTFVYTILVHQAGWE